ncbi:MAG: peroxiredoxin family protein [Acidobacteriota bacterium]
MPRRHRDTAGFIGRRLSGLAAAGLLLTAGAIAGPRQDGTPAAPTDAPARVEIGQAAPDFDLVDTDGTHHSLAQLRDKKNLVLVFFRGTW